MKIKEIIISEISKKEKINVSQFIEFCLYGDDGYYIKNNAIGKKNDFMDSHAYLHFNIFIYHGKIRLSTIFSN